MKRLRSFKVLGAMTVGIVGMAGATQASNVLSLASSNVSTAFTIGATAADQAALSYATANYTGSGTASVIKTESDTEKGVAVFDVTVLAPNGTTYTVVIRASDGTVLSSKVAETPASTTTTSTLTATTTISAAAADQAALAYATANYTGSGTASVVKTESDTENGVAVFSVSVLAPNGTTYLVEVRASDGTILFAKAIGMEDSTTTTTQAPASNISAAAADQAATAYVTTNYGGSGTASVIKTQFDTEEGISIYDVTVLAPNGTTYMVVIRASDGTVISSKAVGMEDSTTTTTQAPASNISAAAADQAALAYATSNYGGSGTASVTKTQSDSEEGVLTYDVTVLAPNGTTYMVVIRASDGTVISSKAVDSVEASATVQISTSSGS